MFVTRFLTSLLIAASLAAGEATADEVTVQTVPPVVVKTVPEAGATGVDPKLTEIKVTFSKEMTDDSWSWVNVSENTSLETTGKPKYLEGKRTCVLSVRLQPGRTYAVRINSEDFGNFKDTDGRSALPYLLVFETKQAGKDAAAAPSRTEPDAAALGRGFDELWSAMDRHYSHFASKKDVDWKALKERYRPRAVQAKDVKAFAAVLKDLLAHLKDIHVWIETPDGPVATYRSIYRRNWNREATLALLEERTDCGYAIVGKVKGGGFGYFLMVDQGKTNAEGLSKAAEAIGRLQNAAGFIVDLRSASGGDERKARRIARLFCDKDVVYAKSKYRDGPGHEHFNQPAERVLQASERAFRGPVVCLIGPGAVSSGEAFVQMMKCLPLVTTVGLPTRGASGNPQPVKLADLGLSVYFSRWVDMMPDGSGFEGIGIQPDVSVDLPPRSYATADPTLTKGLEVLRKKQKEAATKPAGTRN
jgi:RNA polymerase sigma-70 factor (ECF subfamily)